MSLLLASLSRTHKITICGTVFYIASMSIGKKESVVSQIRNLGSEDGAFERLLGIITPIITSIDGYKESPMDVLTALEDLGQLRDIVHAVIAHCSLTSDEVKNLSSSSGQPTPDLAGNAK